MDVFRDGFSEPAMDGVEATDQSGVRPVLNEDHITDLWGTVGHGHHRLNRLPTCWCGVILGMFRSCASLTRNQGRVFSSIGKANAQKRSRLALESHYITRYKCRHWNTCGSRREIMGLLSCRQLYGVRCWSFPPRTTAVRCQAHAGRNAIESRPPA